MDKKIFYYEKQQFNQWYIILFFIAIDGFVISQVIMPQDFNTACVHGDIFGLVILALVNLLFLILKMETTITEDGLYLRYFPIIKNRSYRWEDIAHAQTVKYNPIAYGGWGIRYGVYSVSGNKALQLRFKNGTKLLIGTCQPQAIQDILNTIQKNENHTI